VFGKVVVDHETQVEPALFGLLRAGTVEPLYPGISAATTVLLLVTGLLVFNRVERTFIDTV